MIYRKKLFLLILISAFLVSFLNIVSSYAQTEVEIQSLNSSLFPFIYSNVQVISNGNPVANLTKSDFEIYENDILQSEYFEVTPPQSGGGVRLADIVFLIDCSDPSL